jgi:enoyl-CoA hydratase/carnithine racemase
LLIVVSYTDAKALDIILTGKSITAGKTKKFGLVDHVIMKYEMLLITAKKWA